MKKPMVAIRELDEETFRKFRAKAIEERMKVGEALTLAMREWLQRKERKTIRKELLKIPQFNWGKGTEKTSMEINEILYGKKK